MKRALTLLLAALVLTGALSACGNAPRPAEEDPLTLLRQEIAADGSQLGVAYLGMMGDGDMAAWLAPDVPVPDGADGAADGDPARRRGVLHRPGGRRSQPDGAGL